MVDAPYLGTGPKSVVGLKKKSFQAEENGRLL